MATGDGHPLNEGKPVEKQRDQPHQAAAERQALLLSNDAKAGGGPARGGRRGLWFFLTFVVIAGVLVGVFWDQVKGVFATGSPPPNAQAAAATRPVPVDTAEVRRGTMALYLTGLGNVTPLNTVVIHTRVDGQLDQVAFTEGQMVREGDLLAQIDPRPFQAQLATAQGQMARDEAQLSNARTTLARDKAAGAAVSALQLDNDTAAVAQAEGVVKVDQASIDSANLQLSYARVTAPIAGRIGLRAVDPGNIVHANDANGLATITQVQPIAVKFSLPQDAIPRVLGRLHPIVQVPAGLGMPSAVTDLLGLPLLPVMAYGRDAGHQSIYLATGNVMAIDSQIDQSIGTVLLKAVFLNTHEQLFPNQYVNARLLIEVRKDALLIPKAAVLHDSSMQTFVYVVDPQSSEVGITPITAGPTEGETTLVENGLSEGQVVVINGIDKLQQGKKVMPRGREGQQPSPGAGAARDSGQVAKQPMKPPMNQPSKQPPGQP